MEAYEVKAFESPPVSRTLHYTTSQDAPSPRQWHGWCGGSVAGGVLQQVLYILAWVPAFDMMAFADPLHQPYRVRESWSLSSLKHATAVYW